MRIAIDARFYRSQTGGIGRYTQNLIAELAKIDQKNQYAIFITPADNKEYERYAICNMRYAKNFTKKIIPITHYSLSEQTKFLKILNRGKFDLVHFLNFNHPIFYKKPFITTIHDLTMLLYPAGFGQKSFIKRQAFKTVMKNAVKNSKAVIVVSQATQKDCVKYLDANSQKIKVIYEAVSPAYMRGISNFQFPHSTSSGQAISNQITNPNFPNPNKLMKPWKLKSYLLFVSQWRPHKGLPELIKAFEILKSKYKIPHQLVITGKPNTDFPGITYNIQHSTFNKDIITPGFVKDPDLPLLYQNADAFIFPSFYEGFGLPPLEAMACGTPVISSNLSCMPEILGDAARYFNPHNITEMAGKIYETLTKTDLRKEMIKKGFGQVQKYSWQKMAQETLEVYNETSSV